MIRIFIRNRIPVPSPIAVGGTGNLPLVAPGDACAWLCFRAAGRRDFSRGLPCEVLSLSKVAE